MESVSVYCVYTDISRKVDWLIINIVLHPFWKCFINSHRAVTILNEGLQNKVLNLLSACGLLTGNDLYRATLGMSRDLGFKGLVQKTAPFIHLLQQTRGTDDLC